MEGGLSWYFAYGSNMNALRLFEERLKPAGVVVEAITHVALLVADGLRPTRDYLGHLLAALDLLPADHLRRLSETPTLD
jgi:hypothetical protein